VSTVPPLLRSLGEHRCSVLGITFPVETEKTGSTSSKKLLVDSGGGKMSNVFFWGTFTHVWTTKLLCGIQPSQLATRLDKTGPGPSNSNTPRQETRAGTAPHCVHSHLFRALVQSRLQMLALFIAVFLQHLIQRETLTGTCHSNPDTAQKQTSFSSSSG
jgi:hypothetical protein